MASHADIRGLSLILGGEIRAVPKLVTDRESAVVLIRGPAGSGKTIFASHLAAHEAVMREGDVIYCCVELLPSELEAQLSGLTFGPEHRRLRVSNLPMLSSSPDSPPRIFAAIFDVPETNDPDIGAELQQVISSATERGFRPTVVVIDSLADGYRLGASVPRSLADAFAKFAAEEGILLILLEEVINQRGSAWMFVADIVLELDHHGMIGTSAAEDRAITVRKNRFGPAHVGPHAFAIHRNGGIEIYPRLGTYLSESARSMLSQRIRDSSLPQAWRILRYFRGHSGHSEGVAMGDFPKRGEVVLVTGRNATAVSLALGRFVLHAPSLWIDMAGITSSDEKILTCGDPTLSPERLLAGFCSRLELWSGLISGVVVGDLAAISNNVDPEGLRRTVPVVIELARVAGLPVALFETSEEASSALSRHFADTLIRVDVEPAPPADQSGTRYRILGTLDSRSRDVCWIEVEIPR